MKILIATDAWAPQINGVARTYEQLAFHLSALGVDPVFLTPAEFRTIPCPTYPEIALAIPGLRHAFAKLDAAAPDAVHIATEGPIGLMTRTWCLRRGIPFTTSFHTRFPEYLAARFRTPTSWTYAAQRWFHNAGKGMMVSTASLARELDQRGFKRIIPWSRGVDTGLFRPRAERLFGTDRPVMLYVGRIAPEKNIETFLRLSIPGRKVVVGSGPLLDSYRRSYPDVTFTGLRTGEDLARCYASADVMVFPSRTDTFGIVMLEAMASGVPVAAFPVIGPRDVVAPGVTGILDDDLGRAVSAALTLDRARVRECAMRHAWEDVAKLFLSNIETVLFTRQGRSIPGRLAVMRQQASQS